MQALFTLTPAESKRLIARGIVSIPEVQQAKEEGYLIVGRGSTNAYIVEELQGKSIEKEKYSCRTGHQGDHLRAPSGRSSSTGYFLQESVAGCRPVHRHR